MSVLLLISRTAGRRPLLEIVISLEAFLCHHTFGSISVVPKKSRKSSTNILLRALKENLSGPFSPLVEADGIRKSAEAGYTRCSVLKAKFFCEPSKKGRDFSVKRKRNRSLIRILIN